MDEWDRYHYWHNIWYRLGQPQGYEPMRPFQTGSHIDSLPVENNQRCYSGILIPIGYTREVKPPEFSRVPMIEVQMT